MQTPTQFVPTPPAAEPLLRDEYPRLRPQPAPEPGNRFVSPAQPPRRFGFRSEPPPPPPPRIESPWIDYLEELVGAGGPEPEQYPRLQRCFLDIAREGTRTATRAELAMAARAALAPILIRATLLGTLHLRARGHPGDFELIERILSYHHSPDPNLVRWDAWCHALPLARAWRNRAAHLREHLRRLEGETDANPIRVLHLRSGPGRELADYFIARGQDTRLRADCVDPDPLAAPHGRRSVARLTDRLTFHTASPLRFRSPHPYRLVWVSGLAEGLSDRGTVVVLRKLLGMLEPGGMLVFCQLDGPDPTAPILDVLSGWRLTHRNAAHLQALAIQAGAQPRSIRVVHDPQYPNLYLQVTPATGIHRTLARGIPRRSSQ